MRIDSHGHGLHADRGPNGTFLPPLRMGWTAGPQSPEAYVLQSRSLGIEQVLLLDPPDICFPLKKIFGEFVIPIPLVDIDTVTPAQIDSLLNRGAKGIKFIAPMHPYSENRYFPLYDIILDHRALAVFHTGYLSDVLFRPGALLGRPEVVDITHMRPAALDRIARAFPDLNILMAHFGNPWWEEAWTVVRCHKNMYADLSGGTAYRKPMSLWKDLFTFDGKLDTGTLEKLCFGTDGSVCFQGIYQCQALIDFYERLYEALGVPAELRERIDRGNLQRLIAQVKPV